MGGGKGAIDRYVTPIKAGRVIIEVGGKCELEQVMPFLREVAEKLPFRARAVSQKQLDEEQSLLLEKELANVNPYTTEYLIRNDFAGCHDWISPYDKKWFFKHV